MGNNPFASTDPQNHQGDNVWFTPPEIIKPLGHFDMDVCTMSWRPFDVADFHIEHDLGMDAFHYDWNGFIWMNPPYGKELGPFIEKFIEHRNGIGLVFSRMGNKYIQQYLSHRLPIFFLRKRIKFISRDGKKNTNAGADSCLLLNSDESIRRVKNSGLIGQFVNLKR